MVWTNVSQTGSKLHYVKKADDSTVQRLYVRHGQVLSVVYHRALFWDQFCLCVT